MTGDDWAELVRVLARKMVASTQASALKITQSCYYSFDHYVDSHVESARACIAEKPGVNPFPHRNLA